MPHSNRHKPSDNVEFLPSALEVLETPPAPFGRIIAITISVFFGLLILWSIWGTVDIVVVAEGQAFPTGKVKSIQPLETGVVRAIHVEDGQKVRQGELLLELDPTETSANLESLKSDLVQAKVDAALGAAMLNENSTDAYELPEETPLPFAVNNQVLLKEAVGRFNASLASIDAETEQQEAIIRASEIEKAKLVRTLPLVEERLGDLSDLMQKGLAEKPDVLQLQLQAIEMQAQIDNLVETRKQAEASLNTLKARSSETIAVYRADAAERRQNALTRIISLEQSVKKETHRQHYRQLRAPVDSFVDKLAITTIGAVVETGENLLSVVPTGAELEIEALILNKDAGFVDAGQEAEIKLEAFPFTRYGILRGKVQSVSSDVTMHEQLGPVYKAKVRIDTQTIEIAGDAVALVPGMRATVEVKTGRRWIIEFFLSPLLRYKDEAIRER